MKLLVITFTDDTTNPGLKHLIDSLKKHGYDYAVLSGPQFSWGGDNFAEIVKWLKVNRKDYTHILYTDAWDTLAFDNHQNCIEEYKAIYPPLSEDMNYWLFSGEKNPCFWVGDKSVIALEGRWKYLCAGGYIAPINLYIELVESNPRNKNENDQQWASRIYKEDNHGFVLIDVGCRIFQALYNMNGLHQPVNDGEFAINDRYEFVNLITGTKPIFVHGNGKVDMRSIYHHKYKK